MSVITRNILVISFLSMFSPLPCYGLAVRIQASPIPSLPLLGGRERFPHDLRRQVAGPWRRGHAGRGKRVATGAGGRDGRGKSVRRVGGPPHPSPLTMSVHSPSQAQSRKLLSSGYRTCRHSPQVRLSAPLLPR